MVALEMAGVAGMDAATEQTRQLVAFTIEGQPFGFAIDRVREIVQMVEITPLPEAPAHVQGAMNVRGTVVPLLDLRTLLGFSAKPYTLSTPIVLIEGRGRLVGVAVDDVSDVLTVTSSSLEPPAEDHPVGTRLAAICKLEEGMLLVLDPDELVGSEQLAEVGTEQET